MFIIIALWDSNETATGRDSGHDDITSGAARDSIPDNGVVDRTHLSMLIMLPY